MANVTVSSTIDTLLQSADAAEAKTAISAATAGSVSALSSNALVLAEKEWPIKTVTWATNQTLTYSGGTDTAGDGVIIQANVTTQFVLTVTPTSSTIYRNGSVSSLSGTITVPVGKHRFVFWTPDDGTTLYMEDTVFAAVDVPVAATPSNYTAATPDVEAHLAGIDDALASAGGGKYYMLPFSSCLLDSPSDNSTRYIGYGYPVNGTYDNVKFAVPITGTITKVLINVRVTGTLGDSSTVTHYITINGSDTAVGSAVAYDASIVRINSGTLSLAVTAGDYVALKGSMANWPTTNPTSVYWSGFAVVSY